jgi:ankyrin repeat protein
MIVILLTLLIPAIDAAGDDETTLLFAVSHGLINRTKTLLHDGASPNVRDQNDHTPLMIAAEKGHTEIVQILLLTHKVDINALMDRASQISDDLRKDEQIMREYGLSKAFGTGMNLPYRSDKDFGMTALMLASMNGHLEIIHLLLKRNADVNVKNMQCDTALTLAEANGYFDIRYVLLEHGADEKLKHECLKRDRILVSKKGTFIMHKGSLLEPDEFRRSFQSK